MERDFNASSWNLKNKKTFLCNLCYMKNNNLIGLSSVGGYNIYYSP